VNKYRLSGRLLLLLLCVPVVVGLKAIDWAQTSPASSPSQQESKPAADGAKASSTSLQQSGPITIPAPVLKVKTRLVLVDTVVTDRSGKPVLNLKPEDFQVTDDGAPQKLRIFRMDQLVTRETATAPKRQLGPGTYTNIPDPGSVSGPPTVLLVDGVNTPSADQSRMRRQLLTYLKKLGPRRNIAIYLLGRNLSVLQDFTDDPEALRAAVAKTTISTSTAAVNGDPEAGPDDLFIRDFGDTAAMSMTPGMIQRLREFETEQLSRETDQRVAITMAALNKIAQIMAGYPGRKNLIWLSGAFPMSIVPDQSSKVGFDAQRNYAGQISVATNSLADAQVVLYTVDVRGLVDASPGAASSGRDATGSQRRGGPAQDELSRRAGVENDIHDAEKALAEETGGLAYFNSNDIQAALERSVADGSTYYTLGYYPENTKWDGKFHKISVKVAKSGLHVRSRKGYYAADVALMKKINEDEARVEFLSALTPGTPALTGLPFLASVQAPAKAGEPVTIQYSVEPHSISFDDEKHAKLDFIVRAFDEHGKVAGNQSETVALDDPKPEVLATIRQRGLRVKQTIQLPPGKFGLKIGVRDAKSNVIGTISAIVQVPAT
jgi:VWFA-related protein